MSMVTSKKKQQQNEGADISSVDVSYFFSNKKNLYFKKDFTLKITLWKKKFFSGGDL